MSSTLQAQAQGNQALATASAQAIAAACNRVGPIQGWLQLHCNRVGPLHSNGQWQAHTSLLLCTHNIVHSMFCCECTLWHDGWSHTLNQRLSEISLRLIKSVLLDSSGSGLFVDPHLYHTRTICLSYD